MAGNENRAQAATVPRRERVTGPAAARRIDNGPPIGRGLAVLPHRKRGAVARRSTREFAAHPRSKCQRAVAAKVSARSVAGARVAACTVRPVVALVGRIGTAVAPHRAERDHGDSRTISHAPAALRR